MPAPLPDRAALQAEVLRRVAEGDLLKDVCATPGMPHPRTVYGWTWKDPAFDAALAAAVRQGRYMRLYAINETLQAAFLARLAQGEPIARLTADPHLPRAGTIAFWRRHDPIFAAEVKRLVALHRVERPRRVHALRYRPWTEAEGDRVLIQVSRGVALSRVRSVDPTLPAPWLIARWRRESPQFAADLAVHLRLAGKGRSLRRRRALLDDLCERLIEGGSFNSLQGRDGLPSRRTLGAWTRLDSEFARRVADACEGREAALVDQQLDLIDPAAAPKARDLRRRLAPLSRRINSLRTRPGLRRTRPT